MKYRKIFAAFMAAVMLTGAVTNCMTVKAMAEGMEENSPAAATPGDAVGYGTGMEAGETAVCEKEHFNVEFRLDSEWNNAYNATVTIRNTCDKVIDNWYLDFELADEIQNLQCGTILQHEGGRYLVKNAGWNQDIPAGGSVSFTFTAGKSGEYVAAPDDYSMDTAEAEVPQESYSADFVVQSDWGAGFTSNLVITNVSDTAISDWKLSFDFAGSISSLGGGTITHTGGVSYEVGNAGYNQQIAPGQSLYIQIIGSRADSSAIPRNIRLKTVEYYTGTDTPLPDYEGTYATFGNSAAMADIDRIKDLNGGAVPVMYLDEEDYIPNFICGKYSDCIVTDYETAVSSLEDVTGLMCIDWDNTGFKGVSENSYENRHYYRLQQMYKGFEVLGKQLIVSTDENGVITSLSGNFDPLYDIDVNPEISYEAAVECTRGVTGTEPENTELMVYRIEAGYDALVWYCSYGSRSVIINAVDGGIVSDGSTDLEITGIYEEGEALRDSSYSGRVYVENVDGTIYAQDNIRNIEMRTFNKNKVNGGDDVREFAIEKSTDSTWDIHNMKYMIYTAQAHDFYNEVLGLKSFSDKYGKVIVLRSVEDEESENNAYSNVRFGPSGKIDCGYILYCNDMKPNLNTAVHEYSHLVQKYICNNTGGKKWLATIYEAYSDIMAEMAEIRYYGYSQDNLWKNQFRDIVNGCEAGGEKYPVKVSEIDSENDRDKTHKNSMVLSHAFYKMYMDGFDDMETISELIYRSIFYYATEIEYEYAYPAIMQAASDMKLSDEQKQIIDRALREAEIYSEEYKTGFFSYGISVVDFTTGAYVDKAKITIKNTGSNEVTELKTDSNGKAHFDITMNRYIVNIGAKGYISDTFYIDVADEPANSIVIELIQKKYAGKENSISGTIIDVSTGKGVEGATVRIRQGQDKKYGPVSREYCCVTDENGIYSFDGLETGYYTVEVEKYGYVTEYLSTWSVPQEALEDDVPRTVNYNICIYPRISGGEYRVVLEWNRNPQDLDSHIICGENGIERYHIYYGNKKSILNDGSAVQLDVDDMNGYGPETVSFTLNDGYCYRYYVHWFSGSGTWDTSGAKVTIFCGNRRIRSYSVGKSGYISDRSWNVFSIENGRIVEAER